MLLTMLVSRFYEKLEAHPHACETGAAVSDPGNNPGLASDCDVLLSAKGILEGIATLDWSPETPIADWEGIGIGGTPLRVTSIVLTRRGLSGSIPPELGNLSNLQSLGLAYNRLTGPIPPEIGNLHALESLDLTENRLTGSIPLELTTLPHLELLSLYGNQLTGEIPSALGKMPRLNSVLLFANQFTGCIPLELLTIEVRHLDSSLPGCDLLLSGLTVSSGPLIPPFDPRQAEYTTMANTPEITLVPSNEFGATFEFLDVKDRPFADADVTQSGYQIALSSYGITIVKVRVVLEDEKGEEDSHTYTIAVTRTGTIVLPQAARTFSTETVAPGGELAVTIEARDYGSFASVEETLPEGFRFVVAGLPEDSVDYGVRDLDFELYGEKRFTYTATASDTAGAYSFSGNLRDSLGIDHEISDTSYVFVGDVLWVSVSIGDPGVASPVGTGSPIPLTATFNKPVYGFTSDDVSVVNGYTSNFVGSDGDSVYTFDVVPDAIGEVLVEIAVGAAEDVEGSVNPAPASWSLGVAYSDPKVPVQGAESTPIPTSVPTLTPRATATPPINISPTAVPIRMPSPVPPTGTPEPTATVGPQSADGESVTEALRHTPPSTSGRGSCSLSDEPGSAASTVVSLLLLLAPLAVVGGLKWRG